VREQLEQLEKEIREKFSGKVNDSGSAAWSKCNFHYI
jgi:hypothetical protein